MDRSVRLRRCACCYHYSSILLTTSVASENVRSIVYTRVSLAVTGRRVTASNPLSRALSPTHSQSAGNSETTIIGVVSLSANDAAVHFHRHVRPCTRCSPVDHTSLRLLLLLLLLLFLLLMAYTHQAVTEYVMPVRPICPQKLRV